MIHQESTMVRLADYPQLRLIAWNRRDDDRINDTEALALYEANWRFVEPGKMDDKERAFVIRLAERYRNGTLRVKDNATSGSTTAMDVGELFEYRQPLDPDTENAVRRFLALIDDHYDVAGAIVYGSRARGTHRPDSDADVAVLLKGKHGRFLDTKLAMVDVAYDVELETGIYISPFPVWLDEWEHPESYSNPELLRNIAREGVGVDDWPGMARPGSSTDA